MSLPFLKPRKIATVIIAHRAQGGAIEASHEEGQPHPDLLRACENLISAVHMKDAHAVSEALRYAFECLDDDAPGESSDLNPEENKEY